MGTTGWIIAIVVVVGIYFLTRGRGAAAHGPEGSLHSTGHGGHDDPASGGGHGHGGGGHRHRGGCC